MDIPNIAGNNYSSFKALDVTANITNQELRKKLGRAGNKLGLDMTPGSIGTISKDPNYSDKDNNTRWIITMAPQNIDKLTFLKDETVDKKEAFVKKINEIIGDEKNQNDLDLVLSEQSLHKNPDQRTFVYALEKLIMEELKKLQIELKGTKERIPVPCEQLFNFKRPITDHLGRKNFDIREGSENNNLSAKRFLETA